ncbi:MAG: hypothetical protein PHO28_01095 [Candidatus Pacebacteria bacterium]|nr:hypothetical protein [Candidatus Paceibacterota bacterium]
MIINNKIDYKILFITALVLIAGLYVALFIKVEIESPTAPDDSQVIFFIDNFYKTNSFIWQSPLNEKYDSVYFRPRGTVEIAPNQFTSQVSTYFILLYSIIFLLVPIRLFLLLFLIFGAIAFFLLLREFFVLKQSIVGMVVFALFPAYVFYSLGLFDVIPSLIFLIFSFFLIFRYEKTKKVNIFYLAICFFILSSMIRIHNLIFFLIFVPVIIKNYKELINKQNLRWLVFLIITIFSILFINKISYGSFFSTGRTLIGVDETEKGLINKLFLYGINIKNISVALVNYLILYAQPFLLFGILGLFVFFKKVNRWVKIFGICFLIIFCFSLIYYGSHDGFYKFYTLGPQGSLARYFLPIYALFVIFILSFLFRIIDKKTKVFALFTFLVSFMLFTFVQNNDFNQMLHGKTKSRWINEWSMTIPRNSVFLVKLYDKYLIPKNNIMLIYDKNDLKERPYLESFYPLVNEDTGYDLATRLHSDGYVIYLTTEKNILKNKFLNEGIFLEKQNNYFYKVNFTSK